MVGKIWVGLGLFFDCQIRYSIMKEKFCVRKVGIQSSNILCFLFESGFERIRY